MAYYRVSNAVKVLFVRLLQQLLEEHPEFRDIQVKNQYSKEEREKLQVIVRDFSSNHQRLDLTNFIDYWKSKTILTNLTGIPGNALEWVVENKTWRGPFPEPGIYIVSVDCKNDDGSWDYVIDPLVTIEKEIVVPITEGSDTVYYLENTPVNDGSELLIGDEIAIFKRGVDYEIDNETGKITFLVPVEDFRLILADYRVLQTRLGPFKARPESVDVEALPGLVLAFGDRVEEKSVQAVIVKARNEILGKIHGGRWDVNVSILTIAQDTPNAEKLIDYISTMFYAKYFLFLTEQGIHLTGGHSVGGENPQQEYEIPDEYSFQATLSLPAQVYWETYEPTLQEIRFIQETPSFDRSPSTLDEEILRLEEQAARFGSLEGLKDSFGEIRDLGLFLVPSTAFVPSVQYIRDVNKWQIGPTTPELKVTEAEKEASKIRIGTSNFNINPFRV